jgi:hypothetical protein
MNIFQEMFNRHKFDSFRDFTEVERMLQQAIGRGYVQEIPVTLAREVPQVEHWYKDIETGDVYCLIPPEQTARGYWGPVPLEEYRMPMDELQ